MVPSIDILSIEKSLWLSVNPSLAPYSRVCLCIGVLTFIYQRALLLIMNLELLDPFGRQIPDRVDATLPLAPHLHFRQPNHHLLALAASPHNAAGTAGSSNKKSNKGEKDTDAALQPRHSNTTNVNSVASNVIGTGLSETGGTVSGVTAKRDVPEWRAAYHVSYNRRGTYVAVGYGSGAVAVHSTSSRTLSALYRSQAGSSNSESGFGGTGLEGGTYDGLATEDNGASDEMMGANGVTTVSWSRRSRTLLAGAAGDVAVLVYDTTHPFGSDEAILAIDDRGADGENENGEKKPKTAVPLVVNETNRDFIPPLHSKQKTVSTLFSDPAFDEQKYIFVKSRLQLESVNVPMGTRVPQHVIDSFVIPGPGSDDEDEHDDAEGDALAYSEEDKKRKKKKRKKRRFSFAQDNRLNKHPCIFFAFPGQKAVGGSLQINPRCPTGGLAALMDGSLVLFWFDPATSWITQRNPKQDKGKDQAEDEDSDEGRHLAEESGKHDQDKSPTADSAARKKSKKGRQKKYAIVVPLWTQKSLHFITCAAFDPQGERVYAATKDGTLLGFEVKRLFESLATNSPVHGSARNGKSPSDAQSDNNLEASPTEGELPLAAPRFKLAIPGGASAWHLIVSRNGKYLILNSSDGALRLYSTETCWTYNESQPPKESSNKASLLPVEKPLWTFQDIVSKVKFVSCDLSGDGEYVVGGANGNDNRYELSIWNTSTGNLMDKLTGPAVQLYSVAWHPTRASLAVATSDGLVDVWGPKLNWTSFAPDFQALQMNVVYEEGTDDELEDTKAAEHGSEDIKKIVGDEKNDEKNDESSNCDSLGKHLRILEVDDPMKNAAMRDDMKVEKEEHREVADQGNRSDATTIDGNSDSKPKSAKLGQKERSPIGSVSGGQNDKKVDVLTIEPIPMFASDSEDESEIFAFETRIKNLFTSRLIGKNPKSTKEDD